MKEKKVLLVNYQNNYRGINCWEDLRFKQQAYDLSTFFDREVDILPWGKMADYNNLVTTYEHIVVIENPCFEKVQSPHKKNLFNALSRFVGGKHLINSVLGAENSLNNAEYERIISVYRQNDLSEDFNTHRLEKENIIFGHDLALNFWTPETAVELVGIFDFKTIKKYEIATILLEDIHTVNLRMTLENLFKNAVNIHAKKVQIIAPYEFIEEMKQFSNIFDIPLFCAKMYRTANRFKWPVWNFKTNSFEEENNYYLTHEPIRR